MPDTATLMKELLEAGVHFGHQTRRWNPKMKPYIFAARSGIHILDLAQTVDRLETAAHFARDVVANGGDILFVGTKKQAQDVIRAEAQRAQMPFVVNRWLGGTLTNFQTIQRRIHHMHLLERRQTAGVWEHLPKKEVLGLQDEMRRLQRYVGGLRDMDRLPAAIYLVDVPKEHLAIEEAQRLGIPIIAMCDTNADPTRITYPIPANDDAIRAIRLVTARIADAAAAGMVLRETRHADQAATSAAPADG